MDIGAGPGYLLPFLHDRAGSEKLIQIDMSGKKTRRISKLILNIDFLIFVLEKMLFRDEQFDSKYNGNKERNFNFFFNFQNPLFNLLNFS